MNKIIAIAGMGWLGQHFAQHLAILGYTVKGSVTSIEKATMLQTYGFDAYPVEISEDGITGEIEALLNKCDILLIMIPPGLRKNTGTNHVLKMKHLLDKIKRSEVKKVILISSTSVYDDSQGKVTEKDIPKPQNIAGKQLLAVEELFLNEESLQATVVRFGGLFGGSRSPVKYLAGRKDLIDGNAPVNLINRTDCISILEEIIKQEAFGFVFNATNPHHPKKSEYYIQKANELGLEPPTFATPSSEEVFKQVDSENLSSVLNYTFKGKLL